MDAYLNLTRDAGASDSTKFSGGNAFTFITGATGTNVFGVQNAEKFTPDSFTAFGTFDVLTLANKDWASTEVNTTTDLITTATAHGFYTGQAVTVTTAGTLPTGIAISTTYYLKVNSTTVFGFCTSYANALAGTLINLTGAGAGDSTVVPTALASASIVLQGSNDYGQVANAGLASWVTVPNYSQAITADGSFTFEVDDIRYAFYRLYVAMASGAVSFAPLQITYSRGN